jgi:pimeloyl-ACP methyl ester carboxylesterase
VTDISGFTLAEIQAYSWHDPTEAPAPTGTGPSMSDPTLLDRLGDVRIPVHVLWARATASSAPRTARPAPPRSQGATLTLLPRTGHLPQPETPEELLAALA